MLYVPSYNSNNCVYVVNSDIIRKYDTVPRNNSTHSYTDYYVKSSYMYNRGSTTFSQYSTLPSCLASDEITTNVMYRNDIAQIMTTFFILLLICFWLPYKIISRLFGRWLKI